MYNIDYSHSGIWYISSKIHSCPPPPRTQYLLCNASFVFIWFNYLGILTTNRPYADFSALYISLQYSQKSGETSPTCIVPYYLKAETDLLTHAFIKPACPAAPFPDITLKYRKHDIPLQTLPSPPPPLYKTLHRSSFTYKLFYVNGFLWAWPWHVWIPVETQLSLKMRPSYYIQNIFPCFQNVINNETTGAWTKVMRARMERKCYYKG